MGLRVVLALLAIAVAAGAVAWTRGDPRPPPHRDRVVHSLLVRSRRCTPGLAVRTGGPRLAYAAMVRRRAVAFREPGRGAFASFGRLNQNQVPTVFGVRAAVFDRACRATWYRVQLPIRPDGVVGYVRAAAVDVTRLRTRIEVDISRHTLTYSRNGHALLHTPVAVGAPATPTPIGRFYVNQRLIPADRSGPYGPAALGVSAFSNVLTGWTQGGPIGIHGTDEPWSIGHAVSNGCIRVPNGTMARLFAITPTGTPVTVHP